MRGVPRASVTRWRFVPGLPRSVGFGPVAEPSIWPGQTRCPGSPGSSRSHRLRADAPAGPDAGASTHPPPASRAGAASNLSRSRSPSPPAASPRAGLSAARTGYRSAPLGSRSDGVRPSDGAGAAAGAGQSRPRDRRAEAGVPYPPTPAQTIRARSVRRSQMTLEALRPSFSAKSVGRERYQTSGLGHQTADRSAMAILGLLAPLTCFGLGAPWTRRSSWRLWGGHQEEIARVDGDILGPEPSRGRPRRTPGSSSVTAAFSWRIMSSQLPRQPVNSPGRPVAGRWQSRPPRRNPAWECDHVLRAKPRRSVFPAASRHSRRAARASCGRPRRTPRRP